MLHCIYHWDDRTINVEDDEKEELLQTGEWFDHPTKAWQHKYKEKVTAWSPRIACLALTNHNPDKFSKDQPLPEDAQKLFTLMNDVKTKLKWKKKTGLFDDLVEFGACNGDIVSWALKEGIKICEAFHDIAEPNGKVKQQRKDEISAAVDEIIAIGCRGGLVIQKDSMPGTKNEFIELMRRLFPSVLSDNTIQDYLSSLGYKFNPGVAKGKCKIFCQLAELVKKI